MARLVLFPTPFHDTRGGVKGGSPPIRTVVHSSVDLKSVLLPKTNA
jgi:hypothetical protein